jgi:hypothetical protein
MIYDMPQRRHQLIDLGDDAVLPAIGGTGTIKLRSGVSGIVGCADPVVLRVAWS